MNNQLNSLEGFDSGSNYKFGQKMESPKVSRSLFDLSHLSTMTIPNAGYLIPISLWETLPGDDYDINVDALLRVMPQVVPLYSRQRLYVYGFYSPYATLWNNWQVFMDKGYTGNVNKTIPVLHNGDNLNLQNHISDNVSADSMLDYFGLPIGANFANLFGSTQVTNFANISALPFMMYLRIYRDYFMNKNEYINDRVILPDDDSRFRLGDDGRLLSAVDEGHNFYFNTSGGAIAGFTGYTVSSTNHYFNGAFHDYPDDYFMSALPFTQRGTASSLTVSSLSATATPDFSLARFTGNYSSGDGTVTLYTNSNYSGQVFGVQNASVGAGINQRFIDELNKGTVSISGTATLGITLEDLRKLAIEQIELERLARTDGSYAQFGLSFFGERPRNAFDYRPTYIGGTYKNIAFTEVLQTSGSVVPTTDPSATSSPLGTYAGHGITGITSGRLGHIHCDDYGLIMILACIMPDVYYSQGLERLFTDSLQSDKFLPERAYLGMQPILNKEIYYAGNNGSAQGQDNYIWAYQNPYDYLRYMPNRIHGKIADPTNLSFFPYTQSRKFTQLPNWGHATSVADNVRKDYLFSSSEDAYSAQFSLNVRAVRPLPYKAVPAQIIN